LALRHATIGNLAWATWRPELTCRPISASTSLASSELGWRQLPASARPSKPDVMTAPAGAILPSVACAAILVAGAVRGLRQRPGRRAVVAKAAWEVVELLPPSYLAGVPVAATKAPPGPLLEVPSVQRIPPPPPTATPVVLGATAPVISSNVAASLAGLSFECATEVSAVPSLAAPAARKPHAAARRVGSSRRSAGRGARTARAAAAAARTARRSAGARLQAAPRVEAAPPTSFDSSRLRCPIQMGTRSHSKPKSARGREVHVPASSMANGDGTDVDLRECRKSIFQLTMAAAENSSRTLRPTGTGTAAGR